MKRTILGVLAVIALGTSCADRSTEPSTSPDVRSLVAALATPHADDGAVMVTLRGPDLATIAPASAGYVVYTRAATPRETRVIIVGDIVAGPLVTISLGAGHPLSAFSASIEQVATRADDLRAAVTEYRVSVSAAP